MTKESARYDGPVVVVTSATDPGDMGEPRQFYADGVTYLIVPSPDCWPRLDYEQRVDQMANALHEDCKLEWQAIAVVDPGRQITMHLADAHYGKAHDLVRRIWPELDATA